MPDKSQNRGTVPDRAVAPPKQQESIGNELSPNVAVALEFAKRFRTTRDPAKSQPADKAFFDWLSGDE